MEGRRKKRRKKKRKKRRYEVMIDRNEENLSTVSLCYISTITMLMVTVYEWLRGVSCKLMQIDDMRRAVLVCDDACERSVMENRV